MKKNILEEIYRTQKLMGIQTRKPLITEQLSVLIKAIQAGGKNMDDIIELATKGITKGGTIGSKEIDDLIEYVKSTKKYTDDEIEILRSFLKKPKVTAHIQSGEGLFTKIDNLIDDITESEAELLSRLTKLTDKQIVDIVSSIVAKYAKNITDLPVYLKIETAFTNQLDKILNDSTKFVNSVEENIYKPIDDYLDKRFKISDDASDVAKEANKEWVNQFKIKVRENPKLRQKIKELQDAGKIGPRETPAVIDNADDVGRVLDDEADEIEDIFEDPETYDPDPINWGDVESSTFRDNFLYGSMQSRWMELIRDTFRSYFGFRNIETLIDEIPELVSQIERRYDDLSRLGTDDVTNAKLIKDIEAELDAMITKLKSNMNIAKNAEQTFSQMWEEIKVGIRQTAGEQRGNELISYIGKKGPVESIESYIDLMMRNAKTTSDTYNLLKVWKLGTRSWKESFADLRWKDRYAAYKEAMLQPKGLWEKTKKFIGFWVAKPVGRILNVLSFGTFNLATRIRDLIRMGRFNGDFLNLFGGRIRIPNLWAETIKLYIWKTVMVNLVMPFANLFVNLFALLFEELGIEIDNKENPFVILWEDLKGLLTGKTLEMNPYWLPLPLTGGEEGKGDNIWTLGFKQAPIWPVIEGLITFLGKDTKTDKVEENRKKIESNLEAAEKKLIDEISKDSQDNFNRLQNSKDPNERKLAEDMVVDNEYNVIMAGIDENRDNFTKGEIRFLKSRIGYTPGAPGDYLTMLKLTNPEAYKEQEKMYNEYVKNAVDNPLTLSQIEKPELEPSAGDVTIVDNKNKKYILVSYISTSKKMPRGLANDAKHPLYARPVWVKPAYDELGPNSTRTYHNLREFLNLNYKPKK